MRLGVRSERATREPLAVGVRSDVRGPLARGPFAVVGGCAATCNDVQRRAAATVRCCVRGLNCTKKWVL